MFILVVVIGCVFPLSVVWNLADTLNGLMAIPGFAALSGGATAETKKYFGNKEKLK